MRTSVKASFDKLAAKPAPVALAAAPPAPALKIHKPAAPKAAPEPVADLESNLLALAIGDRIGKECARVKRDERPPAGTYKLRGEVLVIVDCDVIQDEQPPDVHQAFAFDLLHILAVVCKQLDCPPKLAAQTVAECVLAAHNGHADKDYLAAIEPALESTEAAIKASMPLVPRAGSCHVKGAVDLGPFEPF